MNVELRNLTIARGAKTVLTDVSLHARAGKIVAILGPSGSGKSTLLRCINRLLEPPPASVFIDESDVTQVDVLRLRRRVGMLFQQPVAFPGSVAQNLCMGPSLAGRHLEVDEIRTLLIAANVDPQLIDHAAGELSGGQLQRVALARVLANQPQVLLLDEPTSALDPSASHHIAQTVRNAVSQRNLTVLLVTHDIEQAKQMADYLYLLIDGQIRDQATPAELNASHQQTRLFTRFSAGELSEEGEESHA